MIIGVPRKIHRHEHRVGLAPAAVTRLVQLGQTDCFSDREYQQAGAQIVYDTGEVYKRADMICRRKSLRFLGNIAFYSIDSAFSQVQIHELVGRL
jgi:alanine dehydrogenase